MRTAHIIVIDADASASVTAAGPFDLVRREFQHLKLAAGQTAELWSKQFGNPKTRHGASVAPKPLIAKPKSKKP